MEKYITEPATAHLSNVMETIKNHSSMKKNRAGTKLSKECWRLKGLKEQPQIYFISFFFYFGRNYTIITKMV